MPRRSRWRPPTSPQPRSAARYKSASTCTDHRRNELRRQGRRHPRAVAHLFDVVRVRFPGVLPAEEHHGGRRPNDARAASEPVSNQLDHVGLRPGLRAVPASRRGVFGQRLGARRTFVIISLSAFAATVAMPLAPYWLSGAGMFAALIAIQLLLGCSQGAIFPVSAGVIEAWFPPGSWTSVQGFQTAGLGLGAALTPPLIASLMDVMGWQRALLWSSLPALGLIALWGWLRPQFAARTSLGVGPGVDRDRRALRRCGGQPHRHEAAADHSRRPQRPHPRHFLSVHELHLLPALELGVPVSRARAAVFLPGKRMAGP